MGTLNGLMLKELQLLLHTLSDGLRQEVRQRRNLALSLPKDYNISITGEREIGIASSLSCHLRLAGFIVQVDAYVTGGDSKRRPDFGIWLPESKKYIYLELKLTAWGSNEQYQYSYAIGDIKKLNNDSDLRKHPNGLIAIGFSDPNKREELLREGFRKSLSERIVKDYPRYEEIGLECVDFQGMDAKSTHAVIGLWFRKEWEDA